MYFPISRQKVIRNQKPFAKFHWKHFTLLQIKIIFKSQSKIVTHFYFEDVLPKKTKKLCFENVLSLSVIAGTLFIMAKKCHCYIRADELWEWHIWEFCIWHPNLLKIVKESANSDHLLTRDYNTNFNDFTFVSKIPIILIYLSRELINIPW